MTEEITVKELININEEAKKKPSFMSKIKSGAKKIMVGSLIAFTMTSGISNAFANDLNSSPAFESQQISQQASSEYSADDLSTLSINDALMDLRGNYTESNQKNVVAVGYHLSGESASNLSEVMDAFNNAFQDNMNETKKSAFSYHPADFAKDQVENNNIDVGETPSFLTKGVFDNFLPSASELTTVQADSLVLDALRYVQDDENHQGFSSAEEAIEFAQQIKLNKMYVDGGIIDWENDSAELSYNGTPEMNEKISNYLMDKSVGSFDAEEFDDLASNNLRVKDDGSRVFPKIEVSNSSKNTMKLN